MKSAVWTVVLCVSAALLCLAQKNIDRAPIFAIQDALAEGNLPRATALLESALREHPNDGGLLNLRGVVNARQGRFGDAGRDFARAVEVEPELLPAWQNLARACQMDADKNEQSAACAERAWGRVLRSRPDDQEAGRGVSLAFERAGKFAESLQAISKLPDDRQFQTADLMIRCLDLSGLKREAEAQAVARRLAAAPDFAEGDLEAMSRVEPSITVILAQGLDSRGALKLIGLKRLAIAYEATKNLSDARKILERAAAEEPKNTANLLELARVAEKQNDHEGALGYLGHARDLTPADPQVHFLFGMVAAEMELPMEARKSFGKALELQPQNPDYNYAMGSVILTTRDAAAAAGYFEKYVAARPTDAKGHYALGVAEFTSGDYDRAKAEMQSVERDSGMGGGAEFFLGRMARLEGDLEAARRHQAKAIARMPKFAEPHTEMARIWMLEDNLTNASVELQRALQLDPASFQANEQLLTLYKRTHDQRAAAQSEALKKLDQERSRRETLMLRSVEIRH